MTDPFDTPFGASTSTVTLAGGGGAGNFDPSTGRIDVAVRLHFEQSLVLPFLSTDVDTTLSLSTAAEGGMPLDPQSGALRLAGAGTLSGGGVNLLDGQAARLVISGSLDPVP